MTVTCSAIGPMFGTPCEAPAAVDITATLSGTPFAAEERIELCMRHFLWVMRQCGIGPHQAAAIVGPIAQQVIDLATTEGD